VTFVVFPSEVRSAAPLSADEPDTTITPIPTTEVPTSTEVPIPSTTEDWEEEETDGFLDENEIEAAVEAAEKMTNINNGEFVNGTDYLEESEVYNNESVREIVNSHHTWTNGIVHFRIRKNFKHKEQAIIIRGLREIAKKTCIKFKYKKPKDGVKNWVNVVSGKGCHSDIGMQRGYNGQIVSLGPNCVTIGITIHEFMHALGFNHEQNRPDRNDYVTIIKDNIKAGAERNFAQDTFTTGTLNQPYDYFSIMHYRSDSFGINSRTTIKPIRSKYKEFKRRTDHTLAPNCQTMGQRCTMSHIDVMQINSLYRCQGSKGSSQGHCTGGDDCCGKDGYKCGKGEGDCDTHSDCQHGLVCGSNNCVDDGIWTRFTKSDDCCTERCEGGDDCCGKDGHKCGKGEGDCDKDDDCQTGLKCGTNNCKGPTFNHGFLNADDCCTDEG